MPQSLISLLPVRNVYEATINAVNSDDVTTTRAIVESLGRTRALDLAILCGLFAFHIQAKRSTDGLSVLAAILLVRSVAVLYDGLDHDGFKKRINSLGPLGFTLVNSVPGLITTSLVLRGVAIVASSQALVFLLVLVTLISLLAQFLWDAVTLRIASQGTENQVEMGAIGDRVVAGIGPDMNMTPSEIQTQARPEQQRDPAETA